jgi:hypothetical protein
MAATDPDEPLTLKLIEAAYQAYLADSTPGEREQAKTLLLDEAFPQMLDELHSWRMLAAAQPQYAVSFDPPSRPETWFIQPSSAEAEAIVEASDRGTAWIRPAFTGPWRPLDTGPPF